MADEFPYDVAFSFLGQDEALAMQLNDRLKDRLKTFIYSDRRRQETLAGRDGEEAFSRVFGKEALTVVVLYRAGWGERGFTAVEATAIRNRGHEHSYDFTTFMPLDKPPTVPQWLGRSRLWFDLARWGVEGAAAVIESRVQEAGGTPKELTVADIAARAVEEIRESDERRAFLDSVAGVEAAQRQFDKLFEEVQRVCAASSGLVEKPERQGIVVTMDAVGLRRRVIFAFQLQVSNALRGSRLRLVQFYGSSSGESRDYDKEIVFDFGPSGEFGWRDGLAGGTGDFFSTAGLVDRMAMTLIKAVRDTRTNRPSRSRFVEWW